MTSERELSPSLVSRFPLNSEYDEVCGKLLVDFDEFFDAEECKLFCCGLTTPQRSQGFKSNTRRAVILVARRSEWAEAAKYGIEMDTHDNTLMFRDRESGQWHMARQSKDDSLDIVVAVMNGISLKSVRHRWKEVARVNCVRSAMVSTVFYFYFNLPRRPIHFKCFRLDFALAPSPSDSTSKIQRFALRTEATQFGRAVPSKNHISGADRRPALHAGGREGSAGATAFSLKPSIHQV